MWQVHELPHKHTRYLSGCVKPSRLHHVQPRCVLRHCHWRPAGGQDRDDPAQGRCSSHRRELQVKHRHAYIIARLLYWYQCCDMLWLTCGLQCWNTVIAGLCAPVRAAADAKHVALWCYKIRALWVGLQPPRSRPQLGTADMRRGTSSVGVSGVVIVHAQCLEILGTLWHGPMHACSCACRAHTLYCRRARLRLRWLQVPPRHSWCV